MDRIVIDVTQSCRSSNNSGIQVVSRNLFKGLNSLCEALPILWDNLLRSYVEPNANEIQNLKDPFDKFYTPKERPSKQENPFLSELLNSVFRLRRKFIFSKRCQPNDIIFFPEVFRDNRINFLPGALPANSLKAAIFYDANVLRNPRITPTKRAKNFKSYLRVLRNFDRISSISEESKISFLNYNKSVPLIPKVEVHRLPVSKPPSHLATETSSIPLIICVSTLAYNKNHLTLIKACENLWGKNFSFSLELIGQSDPTWSPRILEVIKKLKRNQRPIKWLKHVDQRTLEMKFANCQFTIYPSLFEGYGLPIIESLSRGKPCICGKNGALGEVALQGGCLVLNNQLDIEEMTVSIQRLLSNKQLLEKLTREAKERKYKNSDEYAKDIFNFLKKE